MIAILKIIFLLGTLVIIHEFGHFIMAKICGIKVNKFSIGFGPKILKKQGKETEYSLRALPLGGFVQLEDEDLEDDENETNKPKPMPSKDSRSFRDKPAWQRLLVLMAGATINIIFAIFLYVTVNMSLNDYIIPRIAEIKEASLSESLKVGEEIVSINGHKAYNATDVLYLLSEEQANEIEFEIKNLDGEIEYRTVNIPYESVGYIGVMFTQESAVYSVLSGSAGDEAGLLEGDKIISINGEAKQTIDEYLEIIQSNPNQNVVITVDRNGEEKQIEIIPDEILRRNFDIVFTAIENLKFGENLHYAWNETKFFLRNTLEGYKRLIMGDTENIEMQGIIGIGQEISNTERAVDFFALMSAISLSLGIMNLLPIPGLDGGKIIFTLIEIIRRKPVKKEIEGKLTLAGFALLLFLTVIVTVKDVVNLF